MEEIEKIDLEIDTQNLNSMSGENKSGENKYDRTRSKKIDEAIKQFNKELKNNNNLKSSNEILKALGKSLLSLCICIQENCNGIYHKNHKKGLDAFSNDYVSELFNTNQTNQLYVSDQKVTLNIELDKEKLTKIHFFLVGMRKYKTSGSRVNKLIDQCEKVFKVYAKKRLQEKQQITDSNKLIKKANDELGNICSILDDVKSVFKVKENYFCSYKECDKGRLKAGLENCDKKLSEVYEILCCLAEMEGKTSSKSGKGLAGWYNKNKNLTDNKRIFSAILDISERYKDYVGGTGFLGIGKSRLSKLKKSIDKLKNRKRENNEITYLDLYICVNNLNNT